MRKLSFGSRVRVRKSAVIELMGTLLEYFFPLLFGASVGWFCAVLIGFSVISKSTELESGSIAANAAVSQETLNRDDGLTNFIFSNPFAVSGIPVTAAETQSEDHEQKIEVTGSMDGAILTGTFPSVGAWIEDRENGNKLVYLSIGESFDVYKLHTVSYDRAMFVDAAGAEVTKFLYLIPGQFTAQNKPKPQALRRPSTPTGDISTQITAAEPGGKEGVVARDVVNRLLMNPFDEMNKFRLRPKFNGDEAMGIEVEWIREDSILGSLGVIESDIIRSVNGIPINNMGDVANAINSLMNGTRFDVEVVRGDAPTMLTYVVK